MTKYRNKDSERLGVEMHAEIWRKIRKKESRSRTKKWAWMVTSFALLFVGCFGIWQYYRTYQEEQFDNFTNTIVYSLDNHNALMILPDSSTVLLEKGSKLSYRADFTKQDVRYVELEGRAYFDIKKNRNIPFVIKSGEARVHVLGTAFDVDARGVEQMKVTVRQGSVRIDHLDRTLKVLKPQEQLTWDRKTHQFGIALLTDLHYLDWQFADDLVFDNVTVGDACSLFSRKFGYDFEFEDPQIRYAKFTTLFKKDEGIEHIMKSISAFTNSSFVIDRVRNKIIIKS